MRDIDAGREASAWTKMDWGHARSEEHTSELQSPCNLVCRLLLEKKKNKQYRQWRAMADRRVVDCLEISRGAKLLWHQSLVSAERLGSIERLDCQCSVHLTYQTVT